MKTKLTISEVLFNEEPISINRKLAKCLGLTEAVVFQQIHYWVQNNTKQKINYKEGKYWTYNSIKTWHADSFDYLSLRTVERTLKKLEKDGLLITGCFNKWIGDKRKWYTINYDKLIEVCEKNLEEKEILSLKRSAIGKKGAEVSNAKKSTISNVEANDLSIDTIPPNWQHGASRQVGEKVSPTWQNDNANLVKPIPNNNTNNNTNKILSSSKELIESFQENICSLKKTTLIKFEKYIESESIEFVQAVIEYQASINTRSYAGFEKAVLNFKNNNIHTVENLNNFLEDFKKSKNKKVKTEIVKVDVDIELDDKDINFYEITEEQINIDSVEPIECIKEQPEGELLEIKYKTWIAPLTMFKDEYNLYVIAASDFARTRIAKDYVTDIKKALIKNNLKLKIKLLVA